MVAVKKPKISYNYTALTIIKESKLCTSNNDINRSISSSAIKINGAVVSDKDEIIDYGDFLNFTWRRHGAQLILRYGLRFLHVQKGKARVVLCIKDGDEFVNFFEDPGEIRTRMS